MGVLEHDHASGPELVDLFDLPRREPTRLGNETLHHETGVDRRPSPLVDEHVRPLLGDDLAAGPGQSPQRCLVRHRGRRQEERRLVPEQLCHAPLQLVRRRIGAHLLVTDLGSRHRGEHPGRRLRDGVRAQVDHPSQPSFGQIDIYVTSVLHKDHESGRGPCRSDTEDHHRAAGQRRARRRRDRHALFDLEARRLPPPACPPGARPRPRPRGGPAARLLARARPARGAGRLAPPLPRLLGEPPRRPRHGGQARTRTEGEAMKEHGVLRAEGERRGVRFERRFAAPVDEVWDALTSPERRARWLAHGRIEDTPGGAVRLDFGEGGLVTGRVLSWEPPSLLEFEWRFAGETESVVRFELFADGDGTRLVLDHRALAEEHAAGYSAGWHAYLAALGDHLEGRQGSWDERFASALPQYRESAAGLEEASLP